MSATVAPPKGRKDVDDAHAELEREEAAEAAKGDEAARRAEQAEALSPEEIRVKGSEQLSMFDVGGKKAQTASLRLAGGGLLLVDGQAFSKGSVIHFEGTAVIRSVGQQDKADPKTGQVVSCEQKHVATITDLQVTS